MGCRVTAGEPEQLKNNDTNDSSLLQFDHSGIGKNLVLAKKKLARIEPGNKSNTLKL